MSINRGHLKIKGNLPNGTRSFVMSTTPSDHRLRYCASTALKHFICEAVQNIEY